MSKRRKGFPSETKVKRGVRIVHGTKELSEKLGRNDLCPCGSGKRFKKCCLKKGCFRRRESGPLLSGNHDASLLGSTRRAGFIHGLGPNLNKIRVEVPMAKNIFKSGKQTRPKTAVKG